MFVKYLEEGAFWTGEMSFLQWNRSQLDESISLLGWILTSSSMATVYFPSHFIFLFPGIVTQVTCLIYKIKSGQNNNLVDKKKINFTLF